MNKEQFMERVCQIDDLIPLIEQMYDEKKLLLAIVDEARAVASGGWLPEGLKSWGKYYRLEQAIERYDCHTVG